MESLPPGSRFGPQGGAVGAQGQAREEPPPGAETPGADDAGGHSAGPLLWGVALGAAALGGLVVWLYLRSGNSSQARVSHRLDELRHRLEELSNELARYAGRERGQAPHA